jgi:hypothetical protein
MSSYSFQIRKADHLISGYRGTPDLHVHVYYNSSKGRKSLGKYRLPGLEPLPGTREVLEPEQRKKLIEWLTLPEQIRKLRDCLHSTLFDIHKIAATHFPRGEVIVQEGETYINIRIPVTGPQHNTRI